MSYSRKNLNRAVFTCKRKQLTRLKYIRLRIHLLSKSLQAKDTKLNISPVSSWTQASDEVHEICYKISSNTAILSNLNGTGNIKSQYLF